MRGFDIIGLFDWRGCQCYLSLCDDDGREGEKRRGVTCRADYIDQAQDVFALVKREHSNVGCRLGRAHLGQGGEERVR